MGCWRVILMPQEQLLPAKALSWLDKAAALWSRVDDTAIRPVRERIFEPA